MNLVVYALPINHLFRSVCLLKLCFDLEGFQLACCNLSWSTVCAAHVESGDYLDYNALLSSVPAFVPFTT